MLIAPSDKSLFIKGISLLLIAVGASGAAILNMWHDRIIDSKMERTKFRPIPSGDISANTALAVGLIFSFMSVVSLFFFTNIQAALLLAFTIIYYSIFYNARSLLHFVLCVQSLFYVWSLVHILFDCFHTNLYATLQV